MGQPTTSGALCPRQTQRFPWSDTSTMYKNYKNSITISINLIILYYDIMNSNNIIINGIRISNDHVFYISNILILRNYIINDHDNNFNIFHIDSRAA